MAAVPDEQWPAKASDVWINFAQAATPAQVCQAWLEVLCLDLLRKCSGLVLLVQPDGSYAPAAAVPPRDLSHLADIATEALRTREGLVRRDALGHVRLAYPLQMQDEGSAAQVDAQPPAQGAVVLDLGAADAAAVERASRLAHWGAGWLFDLLRRHSLAQLNARNSQGAFVLETVLSVLAEPTEREAALALVNRLARRFDCHQVQLGIAHKETVQVLAVSHSAWFDERAGIVQLSTQAMHEAYDQRQVVVWPVADAQPAATVAVAHRRYAEQAGSAALCSLPLVGTHRVVGVLMLERDRPFDNDERELLETLALALAPALELQHEAMQGAAMRALRTARRWWLWTTGSSHPAIKLGLGAAALVLLLLAVVPAPFRISAQALVEGSVQRAAVAPFEGYLREAPARAGDVVKSGQVLARLEDKDLKLEKVRWESELELALRKESEAMAKGNRVDQRLAAAQANQARAQLDLAVSKLERVDVTAPFDGVVVKGDLSQQLGSPLEMGKVLYELAPLDAWRVILKVDERDIAQLRVGATGELVLSSLPGSSWPFTVKKLTPISVAEEGRNYFRVEAELGGEDRPKLSPNMEGVGKIDAGRASLLWVWSRPFVGWLRLHWWKLMP